MKTNELIDLLATGAGPAPRWVEARRLLPMMALGVVASAAGALAIFGPIPAELFATPAPWIKFAYAGGLAAAAAWLAARLGRPVPRTRAPLRALLLVLMVMGLLALVSAAGQSGGRAPGVGPWPFLVQLPRQRARPVAAGPGRCAVGLAWVGAHTTKGRRPGGWPAGRRSRRTRLQPLLHRAVTGLRRRLVQPRYRSGGHPRCRPRTLGVALVAVERSRLPGRCRALRQCRDIWSNLPMNRPCPRRPPPPVLFVQATFPLDAFQARLPQPPVACLLPGRRAFEL